MKRFAYISLLLISVTIYSETDLNAQPKAVSSIWSLGGIGLGYEHNIDEKNFFQVDLKADISEIIMGKVWTPGACASFTYNIYFASSDTRDNFRIMYFAGPGAVLGWARDRNMPEGCVFGIKGRVGLEALFERNISISACFAPTVGMHFSKRYDTVHMRLYRNGLIYGFLPEIGIKYSF